MSTKKPLFSIVIPTLNEQKYLPHLLTDLTNQSFKDFEVILVDAQSKDQTVKKAKGFEDKLPSLTIKKSSKKNVCYQRNLGANLAQAPWLIFMDADNRLPPYLLQGIKYRLEQGKVDIFTLHLEPDTKKTRDQNLARLINLYMDTAKRTKTPTVMESMIGITSKAFNKLGGFDESVVFAEGMHLLKLAQKKHLRFEVFKDPVYIYSFRRFRTQGTLRLAQNATLAAFTQMLEVSLPNSLQQKLYPMKGGTFFDLKKKPQSTLELFLKKIQLKTKKLVR